LRIDLLTTFGIKPNESSKKLTDLILFVLFRGQFIEGGLPFAIRSDD